MVLALCKTVPHVLFVVHFFGSLRRSCHVLSIPLPDFPLYIKQDLKKIIAPTHSHLSFTTAYRLFTSFPTIYAPFKSLLPPSEHTCASGFPGPVLIPLFSPESLTSLPLCSHPCTLLRVGDPLVKVTFEVVDGLVTGTLLGTSVLNKFVRGIFPTTQCVQPDKSRAI